MFVSDTHLPHLLPPEAYRSVDQHEREFERLFARGWHMVCTTADLPRDGDYVTLRLGAIPLLVRRCGTEIRAFLNVCAHRFCELKSEHSGNDPAFACQYHGWEYDATGNTRRIPDAPSFKPLTKGMLCLTTYRAACCGQLVFVSLETTGPSLEDHLGVWFDRVARRFSHPYRCNWRYESDFACNWKIPVENTVETYHLPSVHPTTLGGFGMIPEEAQKHYLENRSTTLVFDMGRETPLMRRQRRVASWLGGGTDTAEYVHHHVFPNLVFTFADLYTYCQVYLPIGPTSSATRAWMFSLEGTRSNPFARLMARLVARHGVQANTAIQREDASVFAAVQRGLAATPFRGCLGTREERIWCFHQHVLAGRRAAARP